jgi:hypothetical protein
MTNINTDRCCDEVYCREWQQDLVGRPGGA